MTSWSRPGRATRRPRRGRSTRVRSTWRRNAWPSPAPPRALDQPGHVGDRRPAPVLEPEVQDAQVGLERRERVGGDLRRGGGQRGEQRRLAGVGQPDEADVGDEPELEAQPALLARLALLGVRGAWWVEVAKWTLPSPPRPPRATIDLLAGATRSAISAAGLAVDDHRARRHREVQVVAGLAVALLRARRGRRVSR